MFPIRRVRPLLKFRPPIDPVFHATEREPVFRFSLVFIRVYSWRKGFSPHADAADGLAFDDGRRRHDVRHFARDG
jgi:hypothetical protein